MKVVIQLCMFQRQFCQIYIEFIMKNIGFEFFITKKPATNVYSHEYALFWVCFGFCFDFV